MRLMVGRATKWSEAYGVIEDVQDYNLDKSVAAESLLDDVAELIRVARQRGCPAKMILVLETKQGIRSERFKRSRSTISRSRKP